MKNSFFLICIGLFWAAQSFATIHTLQPGERDINSHSWSFPIAEEEINLVSEKVVEKPVSILPQKKKRKQTKYKATVIEHEIIRTEVREQLSTPIVEVEIEPAIEVMTFEVFPNPVGSNFTIQLDHTYANTFVELLDFSGRLIYKELIPEKQQTIDLVWPDLQSGWYLIRLNTDKSSSMKRILRE